MRGLKILELLPVMALYEIEPLFAKYVSVYTFTKHHLAHAYIAGNLDP